MTYAPYSYQWGKRGGEGGLHGNNGGVRESSEWRLEDT